MAPHRSFSLRKALLKSLKVFVLFLFPVLVDRFVLEFPDLAQLTAGGLLYLLVNWLKVRWGLTYSRG